MKFDENCEPPVSVGTRKIGGKVKVHVKDNVVHIHKNIVDKIPSALLHNKADGRGSREGTESIL
jgi:hypothetical protein